MPEADGQPVGAQKRFDLGSAQVGKLYAQAFLGATESAGQTDALLDEFDSVITDVLDKFPKLEAVLASAVVLPDEKTATLDRVFGGKASPLVLNFLKVVARHGRLDAIRAIHQAAHELYNEMRGRVRVEVRTAHPLNSSELDQVTAHLRGMLAREPVLDVRTNPDLIGGIVLRVGDRVYDGSIATQLEKVRHQMIDRSVHEIQSRRDSFRYPEGS